MGLGRGGSRLSRGPHGLAEPAAHSPSLHSLQEPCGSSEADGLPRDQENEAPLGETAQAESAPARGRFCTWLSTPRRTSPGAPGRRQAVGKHRRTEGPSQTQPAPAPGGKSEARWQGSQPPRPQPARSRAPGGVNCHPHRGQTWFMKWVLDTLACVRLMNARFWQPLTGCRASPEAPW